MAKKRQTEQPPQTCQNCDLMHIIAWLTGVLVSLAVGFGMVGETLTIPYIPSIITQIAGWIVVIGAIIIIISAIFKK